MNKQEIIQAVNQALMQGFEIPTHKLLPQANLFADLGLDSLDAVDMVVLLEDRFQMKVDGERVQSVRTLQDVYDLVGEVASRRS